MLKILDKPNECWCLIDVITGLISCEDGEDRKAECSDVQFTVGKYKGQKLSDISDSGYLKFFLGKDDPLLDLMFGRRIQELQ